MGRRSDLYTQRQIYAEACYGYCYLLQSRAALAVSRQRCRCGTHVAEHADPADSAGRRYLAAILVEAPGRRHEAAQRLHGLQLRRELRHSLAFRLRDTAR